MKVGNADGPQIICLDVNLTPKGTAVCIGGTPHVRQALLDIVPGMDEVYKKHVAKFTEAGTEFVKDMMKAIEDVPEEEFRKRVLNAIKNRIENELDECQQ